LTSLAEEFARIFAGLERSHGRYVVPSGAKPNEKGKLHDTKWAWTVHGPITQELWEGHLEGLHGIGVVPIRDDATCVFGAIDVDQYRDKDGKPLDLKALSAAVKRMGLPLITCRTKSGGAHLYLFLREPAPAELIRRKLMEWAEALGHPGVEIFPKQTRLASERDDGSWINVPYQGGRRTVRYAIRSPGGEAMTPEEFVAAVKKAAVSPEDLPDVNPPGDEFGDLLVGAPPCLVALATRGFGDWQNNGMFSVCVYLRKRFGDGWEAKADEYNRRLMDPPLPAKDLMAIVKSVSKKSYSYMCKQEPISNVCNRQLCLTREFGVGGGSDDPGVVFGALEKLETEPPTYIWDVDGARIELAVQDLMDQRKFQALAIAKLDKWPNMVKPGVWQGIVRDRLAKVKRIAVPDDATREGQFWLHLARFCTSRVRGKSLDEILMGKPYTDAKEGRTYFVSADLFQYLAQHRFAGATEKEVFRFLRHRDVEHHFKVIKGKGVNFWSVPAFPEQTEEHSVPRAPTEEKM
jgi:hypothetical protein